MTGVPVFLPDSPDDKCGNRRCGHPRGRHGFHTKEGTQIATCQICSKSAEGNHGEDGTRDASAACYRFVLGKVRT